MVRKLALLALGACVSSPSTDTSLGPIAAPGTGETLPALGGRTCFDPVAYGAVPGDGISDRQAFQRALDDAGASPDGGTVCIGAGRWTMERAPVGSYNRIAALSTHGRRVTIAGSGPESVLELVGDQGGGDTYVISIDPGARGIVVRDVTIDTSAATNTDEQTHAISTSGMCSTAMGTCKPISDIEIRGVTFVHPSSTDGTRKGDCIRLLGNTPALRVDRVRIQGSTFTSCARSGIGIQRNVHSLVILGNTFALSGDQDIDSEPTGTATDLNDGIVIQGNTFVNGPTAQGDYAITLGGAASPMTSVSVTGNAFLGRGISLYRTGSLTIADNTFVAAMKGGGGVIEVQNVCSGLMIHHNPITRHGAAGPMIRLVPHSGAVCRDVIVDHNVMTQNTAGGGIYMESVSNAVIDHNSITWTTTGPGACAIYNRSTVAAVSNLWIDGNHFQGPGQYGIYLSAAPNAFGEGVRITNNTASGSTAGLTCAGSAGFTPITSAGNTLGSRNCPGVSFVTGD